MLKNRRLRSLLRLRRSAIFALLAASISTQSARSADILVTTNADSGTGSLREALTNSASGDRIVFDFAANTTITLASDLPAVRGDLSFTNTNAIDVTIARNGFAALDLSTGTIDPTGLIVVNAVDDPDLIADSGTTIIGDGTVRGDITVPGTFAPGANASAGTLGTFDVVGDLDLSNSQTQIDLSTNGGTPDSDLISVSETVTLSGANLSFNFSGGQFEVGQQFLVIDAGNPITTSFDNQGARFDIPDRPFISAFEDTSLANTQLGFIIQDNGDPFSSVVSGCNQASAVLVLEDLRGTGQAGVDALVNSSGDSMVAAVNALSGSIYPSLIGAEIVHVQNNLESIRDRVMLQRYSGVDAPAFMPWIRGYGVSARTTDDDCETLGYYHEFGGAELGFAVSNKQGLSSHVFAHLGSGDLNSTGAEQHAEIDSYRGGGSVEYVGQHLYLLAAGGAGVQTYDVTRSLEAIPGSTIAQSSFDGSTRFGYFEMGSVFSWHAINWMPYLGLHATQVEIDPINETGDADFSLSNDGGTGDSIRGVMGIGLEQSDLTACGPVTTRLRFGWMHEYQDPNEVFVSSVANALVTRSITDRGFNAGRDWGFIRLQLDLFRFLGGQTSIAYQGQANSRSSFNALAGGIQWVR